MKADMKCLVDGLTTKLEEQLGQIWYITHAMHFLSLSLDAGIKITVLISNKKNHFP